MIHELAVVTDSEIGAGTKVYQFATIAAGTRIGKNCTIGACATLTGPIIGNNCKISSGVVMGAGFVIEDDVFIGPNVVLANDLWPEVSIEGWDDKALRQGSICVRVCQGASIGANAVVLPGVTIGRYAVVGAGAVATRSVPNGMVLKGNGTLSNVPFNRRHHRMRFIDQAEESLYDVAVREGMMNGYVAT